ncbi:3-methyladenine DNA glycosylase [Mangrovactinospora gilvigrisea]|uniref:Putative 3-methyladenine DNA glycosylase n=1 Tax=Mangrovactinospora gilvigrisea TaxID=1428644 RepID=A0A1J7BZK3_9ACTN|nr:DNA-3-methyladenine glycosylase [Mangrovactinospora gilvigrisea]OIV38913.1 3-methyladenine DNA glycosylase [Mangrovactinospora gilvigrisea]
MTATPLDRAFFDRSPLEVGPDLLGRHLVRALPEGPIVLRITEVEAYTGADDPASHAYRGRTARNATMFGPPGHLYVYFIYGMHYAGNLVCGPGTTAGGVLLRAGEVLDGADLARVHRTTSRADRDLASGPGRLAAALRLDRTLDGADACGGALLSVRPGTPPEPSAISTGPRTGVSGPGASTPRRYWIAADPTVSPYRAHTPRKRSTGTARQG